MTSDGTHSTSQTFLWTVLGVGVTAPANQTSTEGDNVSLQVAAVTASGTLSYSAGGLPAGLSINPATGLISGTVAAGDAATGSYTVTVAASNGTAASSQTFTWTINPKVSLTAPANQTNAEGAAVSLQVTATEQGATLTYSASGLPSGLSINSTTGVISGTVATGDAINSPYTVDVMAGDGTYSTDQVFTWTVTGADETTPVMSNPGGQADAAGDAVFLQLAASDSDGAALTYLATVLPDGLNLDAFTGAISGSIADDAIQSAPYAVTVTAADGNGLSASQTLNWTVNDAPMTVTGNAISQEEGAGDATFTVASFTDPDLNHQPTDFTANITWGDGQTSQGEVGGGSNGAYTVTGDHVYLHPGSFPVQVAVTDPANETATAATTATVSAAAITPTGGFVDGAAAGSSIPLTVAAFTDANGYEAASSYTASINWGDGSSSTPGVVVDGGDGVFRVLGTHPYYAGGPFTVTTTLTDVDGTTATATSTVTAAGVVAGQSASLWAGSFSYANSSTPASAFTATIAWGDGASSSGTVSGQNGSFNVTGAHTYTAAGSYPVQVTVWDATGNTVSASTTAQVAPAVVVGYDGALTATVGQPLSTAEPLAVFADSGSGGPAQPSYAVVNPGDGTGPVTVGLNQVGDLAEVLWNHVYQTAGLFGVQTLAYNAAGALVGAAVSLVDAAAPNYEIVGPAVVPGNSIYRFVVKIPATSANRFEPYPDAPGGPWGRFTVTASDGAEARKTWDGHHPVSTTNSDFIDLGVDVQFANKPGFVTITLPKGNWLKGFDHDLTFKVTVVQIEVQTPPGKKALSTDLDPPVPFEVVGSYISPDPVRIDGADVNGVRMKNVYSGDPYDTPPVLAMKFNARVLLNAPAGDPDAFEDIAVGPVQIYTMTTNEVGLSTWSDNKFTEPQASRTLTNVHQGKQYLDMPPKTAGPWYSPQELVIGKKRADISGNDSPSTKFPILLPPMDGTQYAARKIIALDSFVMYIGAQSADQSLIGQPKQTWAEASGAWSVNFTGTLLPADPWKWTPDGAKINLPDPNSWQAAGPAPDLLPTNLPIGNIASVSQSWTLSKKPGN